MSLRKYCFKWWGVSAYEVELVEAMDAADAVVIFRNAHHRVGSYDITALRDDACSHCCGGIAHECTACGGTGLEPPPIGAERE